MNVYLWTYGNNQIRNVMLIADITLIHAENNCGI